MKKYLLVAIAATLLLVSCDKTKKEAAQFGIAFQAAVDSHNLDSIKSLYPKVSAADSIVFKYVADSLTVEKKGDTIVANYGNGILFTLLKGDDGKLKALSSHNLFYYEKSALNLAKALGQFVPDFDDHKNSLQMHDRIFEESCYDPTYYPIGYRFEVTDVSNPKGDEYANFTQVYGEVPDEPISDVLSGEMRVRGKIAGKNIAGTYSFDKDTNVFYGEYGYSGLTSGVNVFGQLRTDNKMVAVEEDDYSNYTGSYKGMVKGNKFIGTMTNSRGNSYDFEIEFTPIR